MTKFLFSNQKEGRHKKDANPWKLLIVDDEESIHQITSLALKHFEYSGRKLEIFSAYSGKEAINMAIKNPDIALILMDVVMETNDAGLRAVDHIRGKLNNSHVRIILRTGQPGHAPELEVIEQYDINDYKEKTELTQIKLFTTVRMALKGYDNIITMQKHMQSLEYILQAAPTLFRIASMEHMFQSIFCAAVDLIGVSEGVEIAEDINGFIAYPVTETGETKVCHSIGSYRSEDENQAIIAKIVQQLHKRLPTMKGIFSLNKDSFAIPVIDKNEVLAIMFLNNLPHISPFGLHMLNILSMQATISFKNIDLYEVLSREQSETINMLAVASEFKDEDTGEHVRRVQNLTRLIALELDLAEATADDISQASILHDIGKLSVPDAILKKTSLLTEEEFEAMKAHTIVGSKILSGHSHFSLGSEIAESHHESFDGTGYPFGLEGGDIPFSGRIVALVDVYDALVSKRPYKEPWPRHKALAFVCEERGKKFDPDVVDALIRLSKKGMI